MKVGDAVNIVFNWNEDSGVTYQGKVTGISYISDSTASGTEAASNSAASAATAATASGTKYTGYIAFSADQTVRLGMSVTITTIDE